MAFEAIYRGPGGEKRKRRAEASVTTSVRIPVSLYLPMQRKGIKPSELLETALRSALNVEDMSPEEAVARMRQERDAKIEEAIVRNALSQTASVDEAYAALKLAWKVYLSSAGPEGRPLGAKLAWIDGRKGRYVPLMAMDNQAILAVLEAEGQ